MIISKLITKNNRIEISTDDGLTFNCSDSFVLKFDLYEGKNITEFTSDELSHLAILDRITQKAKEYCANRLLCKSKLTEYIKKISKKFELNITKDEIKSILDEFEKYNLVNDYEYTRKVVDSLMNKKKGLGFIKQKLNTLGIEKEIILQVISENHDPEAELLNLKSLIEKKKLFLEKRFQGEKLKQKLISFCMGKGYSFQDIKTSLNQDSLD